MTSRLQQKASTGARQPAASAAGGIACWPGRISELALRGRAQRFQILPALTFPIHDRISLSGYITSWIYKVATDSLTAILSALADPTRRAIVARLALGEASVTELCEPFDLSQPAISKHLKVLEKAGVISRGRSAQFRPCRLEAARLKGVAIWIDEFSRLWEERFDRLDAHLQIVQKARQKGKRHGHK